MGKKPRTDIDKPEDKLVRSMGVILSGGRKLDNETHLQYRGSLHYYLGDGSQNWDPMGMYLCLALGVPGAREELLDREIPYQRQKFMGSEFNSAEPYGAMHLVPRGLTAKWAEEHGDADLLAIYREWLLFWSCVQRLSQADDGTVLLAGQRCAPSEHGNVWAQYFLACGGLGDLGVAEAKLRGAGQAPQTRGKWKFDAGKALGPTLRRAWKPLLDGVPPEVAIPRVFHAAPAFNVLRRAGGLAVWSESVTNGNTSPVMASVRPVGGGPVLCLGRFSHKPNMSAVVAIADNLIHYDGETLALPGGADLLRFRIPRDGEPWSDDPSVPDRPPVDPPADPPPATPPGIDIESLVREVIALGAQLDQTDPAVALVRAQDWDAASAAVRGMMVPKKKIGAQKALAAKLARGGR